MNWLLLIVAALLIVGAIVGCVKGFVDTVYSLVATLLIVVLTIVLCPITVNLLKGSEKLTDSIYKKVDSVINLEDAYENAITKENKNVEYNTQTEAENKLPVDVDAVLDKAKLPSAIRNAVLESDDFKSYIKDSADEFARGKLNSLEGSVCKTMTNVIISALGFVITFVVVAVAVFLVGRLLNLISKIPGLKTANQVLGGIAGFLEALLVVWLFFMIVTLISSTSVGQSLLEQINNSKLLSFIYEHNIISAKIFSFIK